MITISEILPDEIVVLATGDRAWDDLPTVARIVDRFPLNTVFVHGYADGLDCCVDVVASALGYRTIKCPSHWNHKCKRWIEIHGPCPDDCKKICGRPAGVLRNKWMLETYHPTSVIGFHNDILSSTGTKDMLKRAMRANIETTLFTSTGEEIPNPQLGQKRKKKIKDDPKSFFEW